MQRIFYKVSLWVEKLQKNPDILFEECPDLFLAEVYLLSGIIDLFDFIS